MHPDVPSAIAKLEAAHAARPQRKMVNITVEETSAVDFPAHGHSGWLVMKSAGPAKAHQHLVAGAHYLTAQEQETARGLYRTDVLKSGEAVQAAGDTSIRRDICGCLYMVTPDSVAKAAADDFAQQLVQNRRGRTPDVFLTAEEVAFMMGGTQK